MPYIEQTYGIWNWPILVMSCQQQDTAEKGGQCLSTLALGSWSLSASETNEMLCSWKQECMQAQTRAHAHAQALKGAVTLHRRMHRHQPQAVRSHGVVQLHSRSRVLEWQVEMQVRPMPKCAEFNSTYACYFCRVAQMISQPRDIKAPDAMGHAITSSQLPVEDQWLGCLDNDVYSSIEKEGTKVALQPKVCLLESPAKNS